MAVKAPRPFIQNIQRAGVLRCCDATCILLAFFSGHAPLPGAHRRATGRPRWVCRRCRTRRRHGLRALLRGRACCWHSRRLRCRGRPHPANAFVTQFQSLGFRLVCIAGHIKHARQIGLACHGRGLFQRGFHLAVASAGLQGVAIGCDCGSRLSGQHIHVRQQPCIVDPLTTHNLGGKASRYRRLRQPRLRAVVAAVNDVPAPSLFPGHRATWFGRRGVQPETA